MKLVRCCLALLGVPYLACSVAAWADPVPLNVPILLRGSLGEDACPQRSRVIGSETDSVSKQGGPNTGFREVGQLHGGDVVLVCERLGPWLGVVYGSEPLGCRTTVLGPMQAEYTGPGERGRVRADKVSDDRPTPPPQLTSPMSRKAPIRNMADEASTAVLSR